MFIRKESFNQFIKMYPVITIILALNTVFFLLMNLPFVLTNDIITHMIGSHFYIKAGEFWRLLTPLFLHGSFTHFIFNTFSILIFGPAIELLLRSGRFAFFYFMCGVGANIITYMIKPLTYSHLGASGAIFGFFGFFCYCLLYRKHVLTHQESQTVKVLTILALLLTFVQPNINITAHLGGFFIGFLATPLFWKK